VGSNEKKIIFHSKYSLDRNNTKASLFRTQYTPDFLIADYYGFRDTIFWGSKDLASDSEPEATSLEYTRLSVSQDILFR
jgi:hypothetical protein